MKRLKTPPKKNTKLQWYFGHFTNNKDTEKAEIVQSIAQ